MYKIDLYAHTYTGTWWEGEFPRVNCDPVQFQGCLFHVSDAPLCLWAPSSVGFLCHLRLPCARSPPHSGLCSEAEINLWSRKSHLFLIHNPHPLALQICLGNPALFALCFHFHFPSGNNSIPAFFFWVFFFPRARKLRWANSSGLILVKCFESLRWLFLYSLIKTRRTFFGDGVIIALLPFLGGWCHYFSALCPPGIFCAKRHLENPRMV